MDKGDSFDGANIQHTLKLSFNNLKSPRYKKRFFKVVLDVDTVDAVDLNFTPDFSYGSPDVAAAKTIADSSLVGSGGDYDAFDNWESFIWDGVYIGATATKAMRTGQPEAYLDGSGLNMSILITGTDNYGSPHRIHGVSLHYGLRGLKR